MSKLEWMNLSYNRLVTLERDTFAGLTHLRTCYMTSNPFVGDIDANVFTDLSQLRLLALPKELRNMEYIKADLAKSNKDLVLNFE